MARVSGAEIKVVGESGQISLGKKYAGKDSASRATRRRKHPDHECGHGA
jgi:hypothetical protein